MVKASILGPVVTQLVFPLLFVFMYIFMDVSIVHHPHLDDEDWADYSLPK